MESEYWIDSVSLKDTHQVSSLGRVKRLSRRINSSYGASRIISEKISTHRAAGGGYKRISLCRDGKWVTYLHHRLVAEAFIPNPNGLPFINHKDGDKTNNHPDNLEWCTHKENMAHAMSTGLNSSPKSVVAIKGFFGFWFPSQAIASRSLRVSKPCICAALRGNQKTAGGYSWEYAKLQREQNQ